MENRKRKTVGGKPSSGDKYLRVCINVKLDEEHMRKLMLIKAQTGRSADEIFADVIMKRINSAFDDCKDKLKEFLDI